MSANTKALFFSYGKMQLRLGRNKKQMKGKILLYLRIEISFL